VQYIIVVNKIRKINRTNRIKGCAVFLDTKTLQVEWFDDIKKVS